MAGEFPPLCAASGGPADKTVPVEAAGRARWPWAFFPWALPIFLAGWWNAHQRRVWGRLPFANGQVRDISATWELWTDEIVLRGVHSRFVRAL